MLGPPSLAPDGVGGGALAPRVWFWEGARLLKAHPIGTKLSQASLMTETASSKKGL